MTDTGRRRIVSIGDWLAHHPNLLPLLILLVGAAFRFYNLNWDDGHQLHPDERGIYELVSGAGGNPPISWPTSIAQFFDGRDPQGGAVAQPGVGSPLNPHYFAYGSLPYYLLAFTAATVSIIGQHVGFLSSWAHENAYGNLPPFGRGLSALLDLLSVYLLYLIGRRVFGYWTGVLAMTLAALTVFDIQVSHFYQVDTVLLPLVLFTLLAAVEMATSRNRAPYIWGGIALGAALATKTTALLLVIPLGAAAIFGGWGQGPLAGTGSFRSRVVRRYAASAADLNRNLQWLLGTFVLGALAFAVFEPYGIIDRQLLLADVAQQSTIIVTNNPPFVVPYTIQYAHTTPYLYQIENLVFWCMGLPLGIAACAGVLYGVFRVVRGRLKPDHIVLLLWLLPYFLFVGHFFAKFDRYMLPIMPVMTLFGAALLVRLVRSRASPGRWLGLGGVVAVVGGSFIYSLAYMNIYAHPNTRVAASRWIYAHVPPGSRVAYEGPWDDPLPLDEQGHVGGLLYPHSTNLDLYAGEQLASDDQKKIANITDVLTHYQYIFISSERMTRSIPRLPLQLPIANRYYQLLFSNRLNFRIAAHFQQHPQLGPLVVHDYAADESFHVYDHPNVYVFRRVAPITAARVHRLLTTGLPTPPASVDPATLPAILRPAHIIPDRRLMLAPSQWKADQQGGTMDDMFPPGGFGMRHPIITWLLLLELLGALSFPFVFLFLGNLLDRGYVVGKTIGILLLGYLVWMAVNVHIAAYDRSLIASTLGALAVLSALTAFRQRAEILRFIRVRWRYMLAGELVFLLGFAAFILLRMWYPDLGHQYSPVAAGNIGAGRMGEKQMELAYLNAIVRSRVFPPYDPFFSHGFINYYYYGFFLVGTLAKLTQIIPATGFNLAIATFFGLLVGNVFSVSLSLTRRVLPGILAAVFVGAIGNLNGAWQVIQDLLTVAQVHFSFPLFGGIVDALSGGEQVLAVHPALPPFDFWGPTRIVPGGAISEFPYFTYLFADLHPHLIAFPMTVAALAFALNVARGGYRNTRRRAAAVVLGGLLLGAIAVTNPWDYPTYLLLVGLGALIGAYAARRRFTAYILGPPVVWLGSVAALTFVLYLPFKQSYQTVFATGLGLVRDVNVSAWPADFCPGGPSACPQTVHDILVTPVGIYLEHFGLFLFVVLSYLLVLVTSRLPRSLGGMFTRLQFIAYYRDRLPRFRHACRVARRMMPTSRGPDLSLLAAVCVLLLGLLVLQYVLLAFLVAVLSLLGLALTDWARRLPPTRLFVLAMIGLGLALSLGTQIVYVKDFLAGGPSFRMNTIFKFYNQIWVLYAIAAASTLHYLIEMDLAGRARALLWAEQPRRAHGANEVGRLDVGAASWRALPEHQDVPWRRAFLVPAPALPIHVRLLETRRTEVSDSDSRASGDSGQPMENLPLPRRADGQGTSARRATDILRRYPLWAGIFALLVAGSLIYTYAGTVDRETYRESWLPENSVPFTLDGMAFMKVAYPGDYAAINWLNGHVRGAPVIAEAGPSYYDWRSRVSMFTGLPTIINGIHEGEQRFADEIDPTALCSGTRHPSVCLATTHARPDDLTTLYDSSSTAAKWRVIRTYGVRYIYVGFSERQCVPSAGQCYSHAGLRTFNRMVGKGLAVAYRHAGVTIYQVIRT